MRLAAEEEKIKMQLAAEAQRQVRYSIFLLRGRDWSEDTVYTL
jgi:hypothetical protein